MKRLIKKLAFNAREYATIFIISSILLAIFDVIGLAAYAVLLAMGFIMVSMLTYEP